jgi:hypothetical protein
MRFCSILFCLFSSISGVFAADIVCEFPVVDGKLPGGLSFESKQMEASVAGSAVALKLVARPESGQTHSVMAGYLVQLELKAGVRYKFSLALKSSVDAQVRFCVQLLAPPYPVMKNSSKMIPVNADWTYVSVEFTPEQDYSGPFRLPNLLLGNFPVGATLYLKDVKLEKLGSAILTLSLNPKWTLEVNGKSEPVTFTDDAIDLAKYTGAFKKKETAVLRNEFSSPADGIMQIGCSADYWFDFSVNGKSVYDTLITGNQVAGKFQKTDHVFNFPVKKGNNVIEVKVLAGSNGWNFVCGRVPFQEKLKAVTEIVRGEDWRPVKMDAVEWDNQKLIPQRIDQFKIIPGSALDLSQYLPRYDIDKMGRIISRDGKLAFANAPENPVKLRGFNMTPPHWDIEFYRMSHDEIEELAEQIRLHGMNVLRFHFLDRALCGNSGKPKQGGNSKYVDEVFMAQTVEELPIDKAMLDRYDYFIKCLRDRGIYALVDIATANGGWTEAVLQKDSHRSYRYGQFSSDEFRKNWKAGFDFLMNHVNPYTRTAMKNDPQFVGITFFNELEHQFSAKAFEAFTPKWRKVRGDNAPDFTEELLRSDTADGVAARKFLLAEIEKVNQFYLKAVAESKFQGFVTLWDMFMRNLEGIARKDMTATAMHTYFAHPNKSDLSVKNYEQKLRYGTWLKGAMTTIAQGSSLRMDDSYIGRAAISRIPDRPFFMTEYSHCAYNGNTFESGPVWGAYAALQGWDMLTPHSNTVGLYHSPLRPNLFEDSIGPMAKLSSLYTAFAFQRGDVKTGKNKLNFTVSPELAVSRELLNAPAGCYNALFMVLPISGSWSGDAPGALNVPVRYFAGAINMGMYVQLQDDAVALRRTLRELVEKLRKENILPAWNKTDVNAGIFQSETGEIMTDTGKKVLTVTTPKLECAAIPAGHPVRLDNLEITANSEPCSIGAISLDGKPLLKSKHILLPIGTMAVAENVVFNSPDYHAEIDVGRLPLLMKSGKFAIRLKTANTAAPKVYALNLNGSREKELPCKLENGKLSVELDTSKLEYGTPYFEIEYP